MFFLRFPAAVVLVPRKLKMKEKKKTETKPRADYHPPEVVRVSLRPEEAVLGHCKTSGSAGPASPSCVTLFCKTFGS